MSVIYVCNPRSALMLQQLMIDCARVNCVLTMRTHTWKGKGNNCNDELYIVWSVHEENNVARPPKAKRHILPQFTTYAGIFPSAQNHFTFATSLPNYTTLWHEAQVLKNLPKALYVSALTGVELVTFDRESDMLRSCHPTSITRFVCLLWCDFVRTLQATQLTDRTLPVCDTERRPVSLLQLHALLYISPTSKIPSFPVSLCHCLVTRLSASDSFSTTALDKSTYLLNDSE